MSFIETLKVILIGIVEGITEWLPISSTGHMIIVDEFVKLNMTDAFREVFLVVIQFGAIMAVIIQFWDKLWPFGRKNNGIVIKKPIFNLWLHIAVSTIPAVIVGLLLDDFIEKHFYNWYIVAFALIAFGAAFIWVENRNEGSRPRVRTVPQIDYMTALIIGLFQVIAIILPGTSRSGATIIGALLIGVSRRAAAEYTFYLAVPAMAGASILKVAKYGLHFSAEQIFYLFLGMLVAFVVSWYVIRIFMNYVKKHDFKLFGYYRIALGVFVIVFFMIKVIVE